MKEATGELNMTVIVAISIGILAAFFFGYLWPLINNNFQSTSQCNKAYCNCSYETRKSIYETTGRRGQCECADSKDSYDNGERFYCPFKG